MFRSLRQSEPVNSDSNTPRRYPVDVDITEVKAREILDSRGNPTIEVDVILDVRDGTSRDPIGSVRR